MQRRADELEYLVMARELNSPYRRFFDAPIELLPNVDGFGYDRFVRAVYGHLGEHSHPGAYEVCYLVSGSVEWWNEDGLVEVHPGDVYFTRPDELHGGVDTVMHCCELFWLIIKMPREFEPDFAAMRRRTFRGNQAIEECFRSIRDELISPGTHAKELLQANLRRLLVECVRAYEKHAAHTSTAHITPAIRRSIDWMQAHLGEDLSVQGAARVAQLSISRFYERFSEETGYSPLEYHNRLRLHRARQLLADTRRPITQIAFDLGFSSSQYFATVFKNHLGMTPGEFRARHSLEKRAG